MRLLALALLLAGCAGAPARPQDTARHVAGDPVHGDARVGTYVSTKRGFETSSYWIEGPDGVVVIDTQFMPSAAADLIERAQAATGKPVKLAVVLHANPDKFNGTRTFQDRGIQVVTSQQVIDLMPAIHEKRKGWFYERYQPDYPAELPRPTAFGSATTTLEAGGVKLTAHVLGGPGCSGAHVAVTFDGHLFVGDLVANGHHAWMELGLIDEWKARLAELHALGPKWVHPGRGPSGGPALLDAQEKYLDHAVRLMAAEKAKGTPRKPAVRQVARALEVSYPGYGHPYFLQIGLPAVWSSLAK